MQAVLKDYAGKPQQKNHDGFVVIGAGLPRTGTMSLRAALGILLNGAIYHMFQVMEGDATDWDLWEDMMAGRATKKQLIDSIEKRGFRGGVDYPISLFFKELMDAFPNAKVVLTGRTPESWYKSVHGSIYKFGEMSRTLSFQIFAWLCGYYRSINTVSKVSSHPPKGVYDKGMFEVVGSSEAESIK